MTGAHAVILQGQGSGGFAFPQGQSKENTDVLPVEQSVQRRRHPLSTLIPDCVEAIAALNLENPPLIVAAGGITTGEDICQCLKLGADAVCVSFDPLVCFFSSAATKRLNYITSLS